MILRPGMVFFSSPPLRVRKPPFVPGQKMADRVIDILIPGGSISYSKTGPKAWHIHGVQNDSLKPSLRLGVLGRRLEKRMDERGITATAYVAGEPRSVLDRIKDKLTGTRPASPTTREMLRKHLRRGWEKNPGGPKTDGLPGVSVIRRTHDPR